ncbi:exosome complex component RRP46 [Cephus cinctus]|uniref:Exosome complex component RRP46 n=1 Tax=Cephus cinctus TaxID=211228 RepID=A0AAJ7BLQ3_CEPCN|nr:exosome complex component RRP46 [Cephus cinctus]
MEGTEIVEDEGILRPMKCELNHLTMPDGSAMFMQGDTAVVAGIYGPVEARVQKMMYDKASIEVVYTPIKGPPCVDDRMREQIIKETCEAALIATLHPGTAICINVQELQDSGGLLACTVNAACLALINSGLSMKFMIGAVNCMIEKDSQKLILDPDTTQIQEAKATFTFIFDSSKKDLVSCQTTGRFTEKEFLYSFDKCKEASQCVFQFFRSIVTKYATRI